MRNYIFIVYLIILSVNIQGQKEHYRKNVQEIPVVWKKLLHNKARIYMLPGGKLPGFFDRRMRWHHAEKPLTKEDVLANKAFIVFNHNGPNITYIDLKHLKRIFYKNSKWDTYDIAKMLKLSGGEIAFNKEYEPIIKIGNLKYVYDLPRWQTKKLYTILKFASQHQAIKQELPVFSKYLERVAQQVCDYPYEDMDEEKFFFVLHSVNQAYNVFTRETLPAFKVKSNPQINHDCAYAFSLIAFKKGDLDKHTPYILQNGIDKGFSKVALFYPIYYSGASTRHRKMQRIDGKIVHGKHYFYEDLFAVDDDELKRCLNNIWKSGLSFTFVPHLENIHTLNRIWESSWRIHSEIPLDEEYFQRAFRTLFTSIRENKDSINKNQEIRIVVASEMDPSFITETNTSYELIKTLKREIALCGLSEKQIKLVWNPNGDFLHGWHSQQNKPDYDLLIKIFENIDSISPSIYEEHKHIIEGSFSKSKDKFMYRLINMLHKQMNGHNMHTLVDLLYEITAKDFSLGEFALKNEDSATDYNKFHQEFKQHNPNGVIILWSLGKWDHANITGVNPTPHEQDTLNTLQKKE